MVFDKNNNEVKIGSWVKVLFIDAGFISTFPQDKARRLKAMINKTYEVIDIEYGKAIVDQSFDEFHGISLALASEEMELVNKN
jgi:hypothetical protein